MGIFFFWIHPLIFIIWKNNFKQWELTFLYQIWNICFVSEFCIQRNGPSTVSSLHAMRFIWIFYFTFLWSPLQSAVPRFYVFHTTIRYHCRLYCDNMWNFQKFSATTRWVITTCIYLLFMQILYYVNRWIFNHEKI